MLLRSPVVALVTPFDSALRVDLHALRDYLQFLHVAGVESIVVNGSTGEFPSLTLQERMQLLEAARQGFPGRIVAHISTTCVSDSRELLGHAADFADAALLLPPYYYADSSEAGLVAFFEQVAGASDLPLFAYHFPKHTQLPITSDMIAALRRRLPQLRGVKDSGGKLQKALELKQFNPGLEIYVGSDTAVLDTLQSGLNGSITGGGNPIADRFVKLQAAFEAGDLEIARSAQIAINTWTAFRKQLPYHEMAIVKTALAAKLPGFPLRMRPPMVAVDDGPQVLSIQRVVRSYPVGISWSAKNKA